MPSFDVVSEVDRMEVKNAVDQAQRELSSRFDFKGVTATIELDSKTGSVLLAVEQKEPEISPLGHSRQELAIKQGLEGDKAKEITKAIKAIGLKVQATLQDRQIRVTGGKRDDLQKVIGALRAGNFDVGLAFKNFRD